MPRRATVILADAAGWLMYHVFRLRRDIIDSQIKLAMGDCTSEVDRRRIGLRSWQNCVLTFFEFLQPNSIGSRGWDEFREQEGYEEYCAPLTTTNTPTLVLTGHMGNWEALGSLAAREQVPLVAVAKPMHNPLVDASILRSRAARGLEVMQVKQSMKGVIDAVRKGKWIAFLGDQDARKRGIFVNFFNRPASTALGVAHFSYKMNVPILPGFCVRIRDADRHLKVVFMPPIYPNPDADKDEELWRITQEHTAALEAVIRRYPGDYFWLHRRWKTQPKKDKATPPPGKPSVPATH